MDRRRYPSFRTRYPKKGERPDADLDFYQQIYFHKLGAPESADTYSLGKEFPRIAEVDFVRSEDGKRVVAHVSNGDGGEVEHHVLEGGKWTRLSKFEDGMSAASFGPDGKVYLVSRKDAPRGKVVAFAAPWDQAPAVIVPESDGVLDDAVVTKDAIYTVEIVDGPSRRASLSARAQVRSRSRRSHRRRGKPTAADDGDAR